MSFRYLDHTADVMFEVEAKTLEEAFAQCGLAMFNILTPIEKVRQVHKHRLKIKSDSLESLLFDFLDELIYLLDTEHFIASDIRELSISHKSGYILECMAIGDNVSNYETHGDVKAPTYNEMEITQAKGFVKIRAVVDI